MLCAVCVCYVVLCVVSLCVVCVCVCVCVLHAAAMLRGMTEILECTIVEASIDAG